MVLCRFIFLLLIIPIAIGLNEKVSPAAAAEKHSSTIAPKKILHKDDNKTSFTLPVEGGSIMVPQSNFSTFIKEDDAVQLPKLPSEDLEEISSKNKGKHVVGRTGATISSQLKVISTEAPIAQNSTINNTLTNKPVPLIKPHKQTEPLLSTSKPVKPVEASTSKPVKQVEPSTSKPAKPTELPTSRPHKPPVLKYQEPSIVTDKSSSFGISDGTSAAQANKPGSHPGMIMPVVIGILVVPLFAVLGYMALKRGQEAWKNRHYKRMDFLLDGMYND